MPLGTHRGGPLVRMDTANSAVAREWGRTQLLVLAVGEGEDDLFGGADGNTLMAEEVRGPEHDSA